MGGLALGARLAGRRADKLDRPLKTYGLIELCLGGYALITPLLYMAVPPLFTWIGTQFSDSLWILSLVRFIVSAVILMPPTILMGATLPVLARLFVQHDQDAARGAGLLYGVNIVGALVGTLATGFVLLPTLGLLRTILFTAVCNLAIGTIAVLAGLREQINEREQQSHSQTVIVPPNILLAVAMTGFAALVCEVAWTRVLTLVLGASVYAFTVVLSVFLAGLGLGAASVAAILRTDPGRARDWFYGLAICSAIMVCVSTVSFGYLPDLFRVLYWILNLRENFEQVIRIEFLIAAVVMFLPALIMGGLFPAAIRVVLQDPEQTGERVAALYTWNTIGSIIGSFAAGFILIPMLGIRNTLLVAVTAQCLGAVAVMLGKQKLLTSQTLIAASVVVGAFLLVPSWEKHVMTSAMYMYAGKYPQEFSTELEKREEVLFYKDGMTATVTVVQDLISGNRDLYIATNGKIDGSSHYDMASQRLVSHLPLLFHPDPREVCMIGLGTGSSAGSAALHPIDRLRVIEIEPAMVEGARLFSEHNHAVHDNPKVDIQITDGRLFLRMHPDECDVVISEPSNPWLAGISDLFTREFFQLGAAALREHGIFAQWVQLYGMSPENVQTIVRTFTSVFPNSTLFSTIRNTDILLLGFKQETDMDLTRARQRMMNPEIGQDLSDSRVGITNIFELFARMRMGPQEVKEFAGPGPLNTDDLPLIVYSAPKDLYRDTRQTNMELLAHHAYGICPAFQGLASPEAGFAFLFQGLAAAYARFLPGGQELDACEQLAKQADGEG
jgi:spermidine synthase